MTKIICPFKNCLYYNDGVCSREIVEMSIADYDEREFPFCMEYEHY